MIVKVTQCFFGMGVCTGTRSGEEPCNDQHQVITETYKAIKISYN